MKTFALLLLPVLSSAANACLCRIANSLSARCSSSKCYDERVAQDFCRADFCLEASIKSDRLYEGLSYDNVSYATYHFRPVRLFRFTPLAIHAIKSSVVYTPAETSLCGVRLSKFAIYYLCGDIIGQNAVVTTCHFARRSEALNLAERSFFITGYKKANCLPTPDPPNPHSNGTGRPLWSSSTPPTEGVTVTANATTKRPPHHKPPPLLPTLPTGVVTLPTLLPPNTHQKPSKNTTKPSKKPLISSTTTRKPTSAPVPPGAPQSMNSDLFGPPGPPGSPANGDYFCLLIPINALSLNQFLAFVNTKRGTAIDSAGNYVLHCPNQFFCIPQTSLLEQLRNISVLELRTLAPSLDYRDSSRREEFFGEDFKALMPKPLLPMCRDFNQTTFILPPWLVPSLSVLQPPLHLVQDTVPCSDTMVSVDCERTGTVVLSDGTQITASPLQDPPVPTTIATPDGSLIAVSNGESAVVKGRDGTEATLGTDGSSRVRFSDGTVVSLSADHNNVDLLMTDGAHIVFNDNGMTVTLADGTTVVTSEYGMVCTTPDGNNTLIPVDSVGAEVHTTSGTDITVREGLFADITSRGGTQVRITPVDTTIGGLRGSAMANILPDGTVTLTAPGGLALVFSLADQYVNVTTGDGTVASIGRDDSLYAINENETVVVFPNLNAMIVTKDEIISMESDGTVTITDALGSHPVLALSSDTLFPCIEYVIERRPQNQTLSSLSSLSSTTLYFAFNAHSTTLRPLVALSPPQTFSITEEVVFWPLRHTFVEFRAEKGGQQGVKYRLKFDRMDGLSDQWSEWEWSELTPDYDYMSAFYWEREERVVVLALLKATREVVVLDFDSFRPTKHHFRDVFDCGAPYVQHNPKAMVFWSVVVTYLLVIVLLVLWKCFEFKQCV